MVMSENYEQKRIKDIKIRIENEAGPTFCLAKWHHVTMYLQSGATHSCYHPRPHKIPLNELQDNPSALHNTNEKKQERKLMLEGGKPEGCQYCWNIEAMGLIISATVTFVIVLSLPKNDMNSVVREVLSKTSILNTLKSTLVTNVTLNVDIVIQNLAHDSIMKSKNMGQLLV
jgi:hypothetical protein